MIYQYKQHFFVLVLLLVSVTAQAATNPRWATTITQSPVSVKAGQMVTFTADFQVQQGPVSKLRVVGGVGKRRTQQQLYNQTFHNLGKNQRQRVSFRWKATEGTHPVYFIIDPQKHSPDSNRNDNRIQTTIKVIALAKAARPTTAGMKSTMVKSAGTPAAPGSALPNIVLQEGYVVNIKNPGATRFYQFDHIQLVLKLANTGQAPTGPFWVKVLQTRNDYTRKTSRELKKSVPDLQPGQRHEMIFNIGVENVVSDYRWEVFADYNNRVQEFNESTRPDRIIEIDILQSP